jgi:hypothetical protein
MLDIAHFERRQERGVAMRIDPAVDLAEDGKKARCGKPSAAQKTPETALATGTNVGPGVTVRRVFQVMRVGPIGDYFVSYKFVRATPIGQPAQPAVTGFQGGSRGEPGGRVAP